MSLEHEQSSHSSRWLIVSYDIEGPPRRVRFTLKDSPDSNPTDGIDRYLDTIIDKKETEDGEIIDVSRKMLFGVDIEGIPPQIDEVSEPTARAWDRSKHPETATFFDISRRDPL